MSLLNNTGSTGSSSSPASTGPRAKTGVRCDNCGKPFLNNALSTSAKRFCSPECTAASLSRMKSGGEMPAPILKSTIKRPVTSTVTSATATATSAGGGGLLHPHLPPPPPLTAIPKTVPQKMNLPPATVSSVPPLSSSSSNNGSNNNISLKASTSAASASATTTSASSSSPASSSSVSPTPTGNHSNPYRPPNKKKRKWDDEFGYDWKDVLPEEHNIMAATVLQIKHAPLSRMMENISETMKLEVENKDVDSRINETAYWVASVIKIQGYYVLLRYEGFGNDCSGDFWIHLCSPSIHHVGWCANKGKPLIPPKSIAKKFSDWRNFLVHRLTGARTLPAHFASKLENGLKSIQKSGDVLEVVDKNQISQLRVAIVKKVVGRRLHVRYWDENPDDPGGFWCHEESRLIHPVGWATTIGHPISTPPDYDPDTLPTTPYDAEFENMKLQPGMKLEAIDPLNLSSICAATIKKVLRRGYVMVRIDYYSDEEESGLDWFCYHISSNSVFPCGFCRTNGISLIPPMGWDKQTFTWEDYFRETNTVAAPIRPKEKPLPHGFVEGMKIEAADLMDPRLICVATVAKVVGRLLRVHFDGWGEDYDQWMDARSPDIYPIGWCELTGHKLEPPPDPDAQMKPPAKKAKKGKKGKPGKAGGAGGGGGKPATPKGKPETKTGKTSTATSDGKQNHASPQPMRLDTTAIASKMGLTVKQERSNSLLQSGASSSHNGNGPNSNNNSHLPLRISIPKSVVSEAQPNSDPYKWSILDVAQYLTANDCAAYCEFFTTNNIDGKKLMSLSKDELVLLTGKVGPAVKIDEMITQLKKSTASTAAKARSSTLLK